MFPIVLHLDKLNSYLKTSIFNVLFLVAANTRVRTLQKKGNTDFGSIWGRRDQTHDKTLSVR